MYWYNTDSVKVIKNNISKSLADYGVPAEIELRNSGKCIVAYNEDGLFIWIRLIPIKDKFAADISNLIIPEKFRRHGVFTNLYNRLVKCKYISEVRLIGVCTEEMQSWCIKNKLNKCGYDYSNDYTSRKN